MDNLESQTYETFERDPIKYRNYEDAIHSALLETAEDKVSVIMVVRVVSASLLPAPLTHARLVPWSCPCLLSRGTGVV
jgi:hypothetical protein